MDDQCMEQSPSLPIHQSFPTQNTRQLRITENDGHYFRKITAKILKLTKNADSADVKLETLVEVQLNFLN